MPDEIKCLLGESHIVLAVRTEGSNGLFKSLGTEPGFVLDFQNCFVIGEYIPILVCGIGDWPRLWFSNEGCWQTSRRFRDAWSNELIREQWVKRVTRDFRRIAYVRRGVFQRKGKVEVNIWPLSVPLLGVCQVFAFPRGQGALLQSKPRPVCATALPTYVLLPPLLMALPIA